MKYRILLKNHEEITVDFTESEYENFKTAWQSKSTRMIELNGEMINPNFIQRSYQVNEQQTISKEFRLPEIATETPKEHDLRRLNKALEMERVFNKMKSQGMFSKFNSYNDWQHQIYKNEPHMIVETPSN